MSDLRWGRTGWSTGVAAGAQDELQHLLDVGQAAEDCFADFGLRQAGVGRDVAAGDGLESRLEPVQEAEGGAGGFGDDLLGGVLARLESGDAVVGGVGQLVEEGQLVVGLEHDPLGARGVVAVVPTGERA